MSKQTAHNKGEIRDNAVKALVRSNLFRHQTHRKRKGKGSYCRQDAKKWHRDGSQDTVSFFAYTFQAA
ncbi:MAG: alternative ribosome rescue factor ArfA [Neisseria sp.]|nr:alternative ribosome rescue factor ArfA [Neisseria sp.]